MLATRKEAKLAGETRYFTGKPCKYGHIAERLTSNGVCNTCSIRIRFNTYHKDPEKYRIISAQWRKDNPEKYKATMRLCTANKKRKRKIQTPIWADKNKIALQYIKAQLMTWLTGESYTVDHVIPLNGKNVKGLHVEDNLRVITAHENQKKRNYFNEEEYWKWVDQN